ncbi:MAG: pyridoxal phosphate-dependent aminotransferase family protein [Firmicutes bacterium]|nr:pyridoxal phosphate-dependent aminotransferase family protein [Bacillota bacterium]
MDLFNKCFEYKLATDIKEVGLYPYFHQITGKQNSTVQMQGKETIMLGSNNYLGLTSHPKVIEETVKAVEKYGSGVSGSRFLNGTLDLHVNLEKELAEFLEKEDALVFSTGFQANLSIISALVGRHDYILSDKENHASIYDACKLSWGKMLRYNHSDMADLEKQLQSVPDGFGKLIVTDGVFSMTGAIANLPEIVKLAKKYNARVMVDDAHGFGTLGKTGKGTADHFRLTKEVDIIMGTFSKSLASLGGYMAGDAKIVDFVRHNARPFIFSAAIPAANAASALSALRILKAEPERVAKVNEIANYAREQLSARGIRIIPSTSPIIPIHIGDLQETFVVCNALLKAGVYANPVIPPATPPGESLIRTSYTALNTKEIIDKAVTIIDNVLEGIKSSKQQ